MTRARTPLRTPALLTGTIVIVATLTACGSTTSTSTPSPTTPSSATSSTTSGAVTGKPGCTDAVTAFQDAGSTLATKIHDLPALQSSVSDLVTRLHTAAAKSTDPTIRSAIDKTADDLDTLVTDAQSSNGDQVQAQLSTLVSDGQAVVKACT